MVLAVQPGQRRSLLTNLVAFGSASAALMGLAAVLGLLLLGELRPAGIGIVELIILVAAIIANALLTAGELFLMGCGRISQRAAVAVAWPWLYAVLVGALYSAPGLDVAQVAVAWTACQAVGAAYAIGVSVRWVGLGPLDPALLRNSLRFGLRLWAGSLALFLNFRIDQILMGFIAGRATLGIYAVAVNLSEVLLLLPSAVASALAPIIAGAPPSQRVDRTIRAVRPLLLVTGAGVLVAAFAGPPLLPLIFGPAFGASVGPFLLLLPGALGFAMMRVFSSSLLGESAPGKSSLAALVSLFVGLALDLALIPRLGAEGASIATSLAFLAGGLVAVLAYRAHLRLTRGVLVPGRPDRLDPGARRSITPDSAPLSLRGRSIVCLSSTDWDFVWQSLQEITSRFAAAGNQVVFVENTGGVRSVHLSDMPRLARRVGRAIRQALHSDRRPAPNLTVLAPLLFPFPQSKLARFLNERILIPRLAAKIRRTAGADPIVYTFLPTATALQLTELISGQRSLLVYHCVSDFWALAEEPEQLSGTERELVKRSDLVFVQSAGLADRFARISPRVHQIGIGVNLGIFDPSAVPVVAGEVRNLPAPVIGYIGALHRFVDLELLRQIARVFSGGSLVVVGPLLVDPAPLRTEPNIHLLGPRAHTELPGLLAAFDVGLVPYERTEFTETVNPTKLYEYLAMGLPVVSSDLPEVLALRLPAFAVRTAHDRADFIRAIRETLADSDPNYTARRRVFAREHDWSVLVERIATLIVERQDPARTSVPS